MKSTVTFLFIALLVHQAGAMPPKLNQPEKDIKESGAEADQLENIKIKKEPGEEAEQLENVIEQPEKNIKESEAKAENIRKELAHRKLLITMVKSTSLHDLLSSLTQYVRLCKLYQEIIGTKNKLPSELLFNLSNISEIKDYMRCIREIESDQLTFNHIDINKKLLQKHKYIGLDYIKYQISKKENILNKIEEFSDSKNPFLVYFNDYQNFGKTIEALQKKLDFWKEKLNSYSTMASKKKNKDKTFSIEYQKYNAKIFSVESYISSKFHPIDYNLFISRSWDMSFLLSNYVHHLKKMSDKNYRLDNSFFLGCKSIEHLSIFESLFKEIYSTYSEKNNLLASDAFFRNQDDVKDAIKRTERELALLNSFFDEEKNLFLKTVKPVSLDEKQKIEGLILKTTNDLRNKLIDLNRIIIVNPDGNGSYVFSSHNRTPTRATYQDININDKNETEILNDLFLLDNEFYNKKRSPDELRNELITYLDLWSSVKNKVDGKKKISFLFTKSKKGIYGMLCYLGLIDHNLTDSISINDLIKMTFEKKNKAEICSSFLMKMENIRKRRKFEDIFTHVFYGNNDMKSILLEIIDFVDLEKSGSWTFLPKNLEGMNLLLEEHSQKGIIEKVPFHQEMSAKQEEEQKEEKNPGSPKNFKKDFKNETEGNL